MDSIDRRINNAKASLEMEGFQVTPDQMALARRCVEKEITYDEAVKSIVEEYMSFHV